MATELTATIGDLVVCAYIFLTAVTIGSLTTALFVRK